MYATLFKPLLDRLVALVGLLCASPILVITAFILAFELKGNPLFFQQRPGLGGKAFRLVKFKSMRDTRDASGELLPDDQRMTKMGGIVRKLSLDEIPQLWNVLKGDMSLIGPRPLLMEYLPLYSQQEQRRHDVLPGISGWAQINGRNSISWKQKFELDVWYVDNLSFALDVKIVFLSAVKILRREGVNASETVTMEKYNGHN